LAERLEPPLGAVHTHHDAREHAHPATLTGAAQEPTGRRTTSRRGRNAGAGTRPADGFSGYRIFGGNGVERWGDYFAAPWSSGQIWLASEYIPGTFGFGYGIPGQTVNTASTKGEGRSPRPSP
jgi:hypothetical protein